jgi:hypothetical protein
MAPKAGSKLNKNAGVLMQAACWKRQFFSSQKFDTVEELVREAATGGAAGKCVEAFLQLGHRDWKRHTVDEL